MKKYLIPGAIILSALLIVSTFVFKDSPKSDLVVGPTREPKLEHVHGFAVDISNDERLLIATHHGLMQFENNVLSKIGAVSDDLMGFTPHPTDPSIYFSSGHSTRGGNLGFQKSTDGGETWQKISDGLNGPVDFHSMTVSAVNPNLIYGHFGSLQHSKDGGQTWQITKGSSIQPYSLSSDPKQENVIYAATANGVMVSQDYGNSWKNYSTGLENGAVSAFAVAPDGSYTLAFSETLGGLGKTTDNGTSWTRLSESFDNSAILFIAYSKKNPSTVYAISQTNSILKSTDAGSNWAKLR